MTKPDKPKPTPEAIDFKLLVVRTGQHDTLVHITCEVCGGTADSRDREPVMRAARIHARTEHGGRTAHIRS